MNEWENIKVKFMLPTLTVAYERNGEDGSWPSLVKSLMVVYA